MTTRMITLRVSLRMHSTSVNVLPTGQLATSSSASRSMVDTTAAMRLPWKGGTIRLRSTRCAAPSSASTDPRPTSGSNSRLFSPIGNISGEPSAAVRTSSGLHTITIRPMGATRSVNVSPYCCCILGQ
jgi:hypothetical protein